MIMLRSIACVAISLLTVWIAQKAFAIQFWMGAVAMLAVFAAAYFTGAYINPRGNRTTTILLAALQSMAMHWWVWWMVNASYRSPDAVARMTAITVFFIFVAGACGARLLRVSSTPFRPIGGHRHFQ